MQAPIISEETSRFQEFWNYLVDNFFSTDMPYFENIKIESNALFSLRWIIIGFAVGIIIASIITVYNKKYVGDFIRGMISQGCLDVDSAKTLSDLEGSRFPGIRNSIRTGGSLSRWVRCVEEDEFYAELKKQRAEFEENNKDNVNPPRFKEPEFRRDCNTMHFYIPEDLKYKAETKFDNSGVSWFIVIVIAIVSIVVGMALCYFLPDILKYVDNFMSIVNSI